MDTPRIAAPAQRRTHPGPPSPDRSHAARHTARARASSATSEGHPTLRPWRVAATAGAHSSIQSACDVMDAELVTVEPDADLRLTGPALRAVLEREGPGRERVIGVYDESRLRLTGRWRLSRERWSADRSRLQIDRLPADEAGRTVLELSAGARPVRVVVDPDDAGALRAWSEAGPSAASSFWRR